MGLEIHAPEGQIMRLGCRVHPQFRTLAYMCVGVEVCVPKLENLCVTKSHVQQGVGFE